MILVAVIVILAIFVLACVARCTVCAIPHEGLDDDEVGHAAPPPLVRQHSGPPLIETDRLRISSDRPWHA
uniref:Secreted protein n=1 Tax=Caenorhabditis tropicalis TaxID=1561998 RepID=A0A1I7TWH3_9PELO